MKLLARRNLLAAALIALSTSAIAQSGSPQEQAACRPDVRRFCYRVPRGADSQAYLQCLQAHRERLSRACLAVLTSHGV